MSFDVLRSILPGLAAAGLLAALALSTPRAQAADAPAAPAAAGASSEVKALFETVCGNCHELAVTTDQRKTREDWGTTVNTMISHGAALSDQQAAQITDYLAQNYASKK